MLISLFYRHTGRINVYSASFIMAMPLFGCLSSIITLLIGSNIARAFGLVGALSLIRFRTAVKEPLDTIFLFWCLAVGMACGTGFYLAASMIVCLCAFYMWILYQIKFAQSFKVFLVLKASFANTANENVIAKFEKHCRKFFTHIEPLNIYASNDKSTNEYVYSVKLRKRAGTQNLVDQLQEVKELVHVDLVSQDSALYL